MIKKKLLFGFVSLFVLFLLTGCGDKKAIDTQKFKDIANNHNYEIADVTKQYSTYGYIKEATVMGDIDNWQIEFYVLNSSNDAVNMFNTNKEIFESNKGNSSLESYTNMSNNNTYSLQSNGMYMYLCRVDNTLLYINIPDQYKNIAHNIIEEIGY